MPADIREAVSETGFRLFGYEQRDHVRRGAGLQAAAAEP